MRVMGSVLAGGRSRRFGSDKAVALLHGVALIDRVIQALTAHVSEVVVVGRAPGIPDLYADIGPLGGLASALLYAASEGYDAVLTVPCDTPILPSSLFSQLKMAGAPSCVDRSPVIGLWPVGLADRIDFHIASVEDRSMRAWIRTCGATLVRAGGDIPNINTPSDLAEVSTIVP